MTGLTVKILSSVLHARRLRCARSVGREACRPRPRRDGRRIAEELQCVAGRGRGHAETSLLRALSRA
jgi:hypothetical protein